MKARAGAACAPRRQCGRACTGTLSRGSMACDTSRPRSPESAASQWRSARAAEATAMRRLLGALPTQKRVTTMAGRPAAGPDGRIYRAWVPSTSRVWSGF